MRQRTMVKIIKKNRGSGLVMTKEQEEAIKLAENFTKMDFSNPIGWTGYYDTELKELSEAIETVLSMLKEKDVLYRRALSDLIKADRENIQLKKQIDLMAEQLAGLTIWNNEKEEPLILGDKEEIKQYFKEIAERKSEE